MTPAPLLSILVPTYNRAVTLRALLDALIQEVGASADVEIIVGDNASTDSTPAVIAAVQQQLPALRPLRHAQNVGPEENFCRCIEHSSGQYFWVFGDDDLPRATLLPQVLELLKRDAPDLLAVGSEWVPEISGMDQGGPLGALTPIRLERGAFAERVNVWMTFISGIVVRRQAGLPAEAGADGLRRHSGTSLVQLAWVLGALRRGLHFVHVPQRGVLATSGNTGGYALLKVFGANFARIVEAEFAADRPVAEAILRPHLWGYLPTLIWDARFRHVGTFEQEQSWAVLRDQLGRRPVFWLVLTPLLLLPRPLAKPFLLLTRLVGRLQRRRSGGPA